VKIAHILPPSALALVPSELIGDYHLLLPTLYPEGVYRKYYMKLATIDYLILDNGIAESRIVDFPHLLYMARSLGVQEVVLPDVMRNMDKTLRAVAQVFYHAFENRHHFRFMLVCQGVGYGEAVQCAERAMNMFPGIIHSFGVPRHLLHTGGGTRSLVVEMLRSRFPQMPIHLLGTHPEYPMELFYHAQEFKQCGVRSCDTSLAWNATKADLDLNMISATTIIERQPIDEFRKGSFAYSKIDLLRDNIRTINDWTKS
jgi:hypothetical protein